MPRSAYALDGNKGREKITEAAQAFVALAGNSNETGKPPRKTDPQVQRLLSIIFDMTEVEGADDVHVAGFPLLIEWSAAIVRVGTVYYLAGTGASDIANAAKDPIKGEKLSQNIADFAPEMGDYMDAQAKIAIALARASKVFLTNATDHNWKTPKSEPVPRRFVREWSWLYPAASLPFRSGAFE